MLTREDGPTDAPYYTTPLVCLQIETTSPVLSLSCSGAIFIPNLFKGAKIFTASRKLKQIFVYCLNALDTLLAAFVLNHSCLGII